MINNKIKVSMFNLWVLIFMSSIGSISIIYNHELLYPPLKETFGTMGMVILKLPFILTISIIIGGGITLITIFILNIAVSLIEAGREVERKNAKSRTQRKHTRTNRRPNKR